MLNANLCRLVADHTQGAEAEVLVVAPALNKRVRHYVSDSDAAEQRARQVLQDCLDCMRKHRVDAGGVVGDADPLMAMDDWLVDFAADEIVIATHPADQLKLARAGRRGRRPPAVRPSGYARSDRAATVGRGRIPPLTIRAS